MQNRWAMYKRTAFFAGFVLLLGSCAGPVDQGDMDTDTSNQEATEPEAAMPEATEPEAAMPEAAEPEAAMPEAAEPEAAEGDSTAP